MTDETKNAQELAEDAEVNPKVADQTSQALRGFAEQAREASVYHTGEITAPGVLACTACGETLHFHKTGHIPPCPKCQATTFRRKTAEPAGDA